MKDKLTYVLNSRLIVSAGIGVISFSAGAGISYILVKKKVSNFQPESLFLDEQTNVDENQLTIFDELESQGNNVQEDIYTHLDPVVEEMAEKPIIEAQLINVFKNSDDQWDYEAELSVRTKDQPYVIHRDEFIQDEMGYDQSTITYYSGDDIMADQSDVPIYNYSAMIGHLKFGHGSGDPDIVYVRNEKLEMEWEILRHLGKYEIEVLGHDIENKYSDNLSHSVLKFRDE